MWLTLKHFDWMNLFDRLQSAFQSLSFWERTTKKFIWSSECTTTGCNLWIGVTGTPYIDENCMQHAKNQHLLLIFWSWLAFLFSYFHQRLFHSNNARTISLLLVDSKLILSFSFDSSVFFLLFSVSFGSLSSSVFSSFVRLFKSVCLMWMWTVELCRCLVCFGTFWTDSFIREHFKLL